ncbi:putative reverse transcriptase zinc-binding domain-containing protein [Helianthus annuus]|nr:putative reverse transcriptase zinc-binding domain-containing protein [Helianthus annuus]KAJ0468940.1 putative reverse transcriptase zinc-binding domain-containing protein [Helianthus annuus]KAJ0485994.1 putative reverse transcriptase zinc-binding domain-containing protein [Helianthus annuus]KAJ0656549.1 putative reverse transcriptase zinc-binding domain-containing protein [Helianthus annuus]KAJ0660157.1 putative reverse transcriptase zinc-binding domain-containing protein [Helianthus annuus
MDRMRRVFFWGGSEDQAKLNWVAWQKVVAPVEYGGLGIGSLRDANLAMLSKWWWRFKEDESGLWKRVIWAIHSNGRGWNFIPTKLTIPGPWKQVAKAVAEIQRAGVAVEKSIIAIVGRGYSVMFWLDYWVGDETLAIRFPALFALEKKKMAAVSDRWLGGSLGWNWEWRRAISDGVEAAQLVQLVGLLNGFGRSHMKDEWRWALDGSRKFTVGSIKEGLIKQRFSDPEYVLNWNNWVPKKVGILTWRACLDRLPTRCALVRRNINMPNCLCPMCGEEQEDTEHLFVTCSFAQMIWQLVTQWCKIQPIYAFRVRDLLDLHQYVGGSAKFKKAFQAICHTVFWCIWRCRNEVIFEQGHCSLQKVIGEIKGLSFLWIKARSKQLNLDWSIWSSFNMHRLGW